jgi:hypothetical protein
VFFLIFFSFVQTKDNTDGKKQVTVSEKLKKLEREKEQQLNDLKSEKDTTEIRALTRPLNLLDDDIDSLKRDSTTINRLKSDNENFAFIRLWAKKYPTRQKYDSIQLSLPPEKRDSYIGRTFKYKIFALNEKYKHNREGAFKTFKETFFHSFPQLLFISLPFFALILKLLYVRRKQFYYVNHLIFTLHFYIFAFIAMLVYFSLSKVAALSHSGFLDMLGGWVIVGIFFYLYKAMMNFYAQQRAKTIIKFLLLNFLLLFVQIFLLISVTIYSLFVL